MIRRKIYYDTRTGGAIVEIPEQVTTINVRETTVDEDFDALLPLKSYERQYVGVLILNIGQYAQDFAESNGYRVNPETKTLEFSYPNPSEPEVEQPYRAPLSEEVATLKQDKQMLQLQVDALTGQTEFLEETLTELILTVVP